MSGAAGDIIRELINTFYFAASIYRFFFIALNTDLLLSTMCANKYKYM